MGCSFKKQNCKYNCKQNKIWVDKEINEIMVTRHEEGESVVAGRFIKTKSTKFINIWLEHQKMWISIK